MIRLIDQMRLGMLGGWTSGIFGYVLEDQIVALMVQEMAMGKGPEWDMSHATS